jgi:hypothetical protein
LLEPAVFTECAVQCGKEHIDAAIFQHIKVKVIRSNVGGDHAKARLPQCFGDALAALDADVALGADAAEKDGYFQFFIRCFQSNLLYLKLPVSPSEAEGEKSLAPARRFVILL